MLTMAAKNPERVEASLEYSSHLLEPEDGLSFIESEVFARAWKRCRLSDEDLFELQLLVMAHPKLHPVMEGTGGVRKIRFTPDGTAEGRSGSHRACYVYYEEYGVVLLLTVYPKSKRDNISVAGRNAMRRMVEDQSHLLSRGPIR
jgi:hypothetical protein